MRIKIYDSIIAIRKHEAGFVEVETIELWGNEKSFPP
jgi:hypothetical protein